MSYITSVHFLPRSQVLYHRIDRYIPVLVFRRTCTRKTTQSYLFFRIELTDLFKFILRSTPCPVRELRLRSSTEIP